MKKITGATALFIMGIFWFTGYVACVKNHCLGVACANNGVCVDGICACPYGYEGAECGTEWYKKLDGTWKAEDRFINAADGRTFTYDIKINGARDSFYIYGLMDTLTPVKAKMTSRFVFTLPGQVIDSNITINSGKGSFDSVTSEVTGVYSFRYRDTVDVPVELLENNGVPKTTSGKMKIDTTMTARFTWKR